VNDTQAPSLVQPANINVTTSGTATSVAVTYPAAIFTDNCPGATVAYSPVSGSTFNLGSTPVTVTATDASGNTAVSTFNVIVAQPDAVLFSASTYTVDEGAGSLTATVVRTDGVATTASVDFATSSNASATCGTANGFASEKCDYLAEAGTLHFAVGETSKTITVFINDDGYVEGPETFTLTLSNAVGTSIGSQGSAVVTIQIMM